MEPKHLDSNNDNPETATTSSPDSNDAARASRSVIESNLRQRKLSNASFVEFAYHERQDKQRIFQLQVENSHAAEDVKIQLKMQLSKGFPAVDISNKTIRITKGWNEISEEFQPTADTVYTVHILPRKEAWLPLRVTLSGDLHDRSKDYQKFVIFIPQKSEMEHLREEIAKLASCPPRSLELRLPQEKRREYQQDSQNNDHRINDSGIDSDEGEKSRNVIVLDEVTHLYANSLLEARVNSLFTFRVEVIVDVARGVTVFEMKAYEHDSVANVLHFVATEMAVDSNCVRVYSLNEAVNPDSILRDYRQRNEGKFTAYVFTKAAEIRVRHYQNIFRYSLFVPDATATSVGDLERFVEKKHNFFLHSVELHSDQGRLKAESTIAVLGVGRNGPVVVHTKEPEKSGEILSKCNFPDGKIFEIDSEIPHENLSVPWWMSAGTDRDLILDDEALGRDSPEPCGELVSEGFGSITAGHPDSKTQPVRPLKAKGKAKRGKDEGQKKSSTHQVGERRRPAPRAGLEAPRRSSRFCSEKEDERTWQAQHQSDAGLSKFQEQTTVSDAFQVDTPEIPRGDAASLPSNHGGNSSTAHEDLAEEYPPDHTAAIETRKMPRDHCHTNQSDYMADAIDSTPNAPPGDFHNHDVLQRGDPTNILGPMGGTHSRFDESENDEMITVIENKALLQGNRCVARISATVSYDPKAAKVAKPFSSLCSSPVQLGLPSSVTPAPEPPGVVSDNVLGMVAERIGHDWMSLCLHLGVGAKDLNRIDHNYTDLWEKAFEGLLRWKVMRAGEATPAALKKALLQKEFCLVANLILEEKEEAGGGESVSPE